MIKVFEVIECGGPGGTGNQVAALCNGLDPKRFETTLVYNVRPGADPVAYQALAQGAKNAVRVEALTREISPLRDFSAFLALYRLFKAEKPDVVHAHSSKAGALARSAAALAGVNTIYYTPHGYGFLQQDRSDFSRAIYRGVERALSKIGLIVAVSESEGELARSLSPRRPVEVVCDAFLDQIPDAPAPEPHEGLRVGSCGRMTFARRPEAFVNLSQRLTDSRNKLTCVWIGGGDDEASVRRHLENMNLAAKVEITGWLERSAAQSALRKLDVVVHYSLWDGLPNAVLEAMAYGLPVVASDGPGNRDAVVHGETGFLAKNEMELLEYTLRLIDDPALRRRLGENGRSRVRERFSLGEAIRRWEELYARAAS